MAMLKANADSNATFPASVPFPDAPHNQRIAALGLNGRSCGQLFSDPNKIQGCARVVAEQANLNAALASANTVSSNFDQLADLENPDMLSAFNKDMQQTFGQMSKHMSGYNADLERHNQQIMNRVRSQTLTLEELRAQQGLADAVGSSLQDRMMDIERQISTKARLTQINDEAAQQKATAVKTIMGAASGSIIAGLGLILWLSGVISIAALSAYLLVSVGIIIATYVVYSSSSRLSLTEMSDDVRKAVLKGGRKLNVAALEWTDSNCECPAKPKARAAGQAEADADYQKLISKIEPDQEDGVWYADGSGPPTHISLFNFHRGTGTDLRSVQEGDDPDVQVQPR